MMNTKLLSVGLMAAASLWLSGCSDNAALEERVADLEDRIAQLENGATVKTQAVALNESAATTELTSTGAASTGAASTGAASTGSATTVAFAETTHEFGTIAEGDVVEHTFTFTNTGDTPLIIQDAKTTCGCTVPKKPEAPVPPGETGEIQVRFNSQGKAGVQNKAVTITANTEPATTRLFIKANVTAKSEPIAGPVRK
ncbi:MAG: DUF1573 domain-containing protein [Tunicatimonas sp.]